MALDEDKSKKEDQKIVGLDKADVNEDKGAEVKAEAKPGLLTKYKKFMIPGGIALGSLIVALVFVWFMGGSHHNADDQKASDENKKLVYSNGSNPMIQDEQATENQMDADVEKEEAAADLNIIDTAAIMAELAFLDYVPEMEKKDKGQAGELSDEADTFSTGMEKMTPQDSLDTLNWLAREFAKLDSAKADQEQRLRKLKELQARIDKAMAQIKEVEEEHTKHLAKLYDGMRAEQVAKLFENLDDKAIMAIIPRMKAANAAKIMAAIPPKRAARISTKLMTLLDD